LSAPLAAGVEKMLAIGSGDGPPDVEGRGSSCRQASDNLRVHRRASARRIEGKGGDIPDVCRAREPIPRCWRWAKSGWTITTIIRRATSQRDVFAEQMRIASDARKPIIIHTREAWSDTFDLIRKHWNPAYGGIIHCFTEGPAEAREALDLGFHISFAGIVTFPKATGVQEAARNRSRRRLLVETDAPFLAPVPMRGKRNEPAFVVQTARRVAELRGVTPEEIAAVTVANFERLCPAAC